MLMLNCNFFPDSEAEFPVFPNSTHPDASSASTQSTHIFGRREIHTLPTVGGGGGSGQKTGGKGDPKPRKRPCSTHIFAKCIFIEVRKVWPKPCILKGIAPNSVACVSVALTFV